VLRRSGEQSLMRGELFELSQILRLFPAAKLLVLHAPPIADVARTDVDRECAGHLRMLAAEAAAAGLPYILTIPPLPDREAVESVSRLARAIATGTNAPQDALLDVVRGMGERLATSPLPHDDRTELSADFCLYVP
jgi:hypothetical protein